MLIVVDPHSGVPVYKQLMDQVKFHVASGLIAPGEQLPSTRALSAELGVNPMTVSKAYSYLEREGVIERRPGRNLVVKDFEAEQAKRRKIKQLKESLAPIVTMIRQLGISGQKAADLLKEMLEAENETSSDSGGFTSGPKESDNASS